MTESETATPATSPFQVAKVRQTLSLAPVDIGNIVSGAKSTLDRLIFRYNRTLNATIISYFDLQIVEKEVACFYDSPYLHVPIITKLLLFKPVKGELLNGTVKRVSATHLSLLVYGVISASISKNELPKNLQYDHSANTFGTNDDTENVVISVGTKITFRQNPSTSKISSDDEEEEKEVETPKKKSKKAAVVEESSSSESEEEVKKKDKKKSKKKSKDTDSDDESSDDKKSKKNKKQSKKSKKDESSSEEEDKKKRKKSTDDSDDDDSQKKKKKTNCVVDRANQKTHTKSKVEKINTGALIAPAYLTACASSASNNIL
eukprot:gene13301-15636_t